MDQADRPRMAARIIGAFAVAAAYAVGCYFLVDWARPDSGMVMVSFALVQPAAICAFLCYLCDPLARRTKRFYGMVPVVCLVGMIVISAVLLQEGVVCILMLAVPWLISGEIGAMVTYRMRRRDPEADPSSVFLSPGLLVLPLAMMPIEAMITPPARDYTVTRTILIDAPAETIWPLMQGIPDVARGEGRWNLSQDVIGIPRPTGAWLEGSGIGAIRHARWDHGIAFREIVTQWQPGRRIGWTFDFAGSEGWEFTDRHLRPDSEYMQIRKGGYELIPQGNGKHLLKLETSYTARTHFNPYAALWGEFFLGDLENNILTAIRNRAEAVRTSPPA